MNILLTGGTGLIGRALCRRLLEQGHSLSVWSRRPAEVPSLCGAQVRGIAELSQLDGEYFDAVINLAGAPVADRPWTAKRKAELWSSRVSLTDQLVQWLGAQQRRPQVLVSGSAVGWYGDGGSVELTEQSPAHAEYTHTLCDAWEAAAKRVNAYGVRLCIMRTGLVIAAEGGFLARMKPPFKLGLGGPIGNGEQYMPWVHLSDVVALIVWMLQSPDCRGVYNASAPHPVRNREFTRELGKALGRPAVLPLPGFVLKLILGDMSRLLLTGQRALPAKAQAEGFRFQHEHLESALVAAIDAK